MRTRSCSTPVAALPPGVRTSVPRYLSSRSAIGGGRRGVDSDASADAAGMTSHSPPQAAAHGAQDAAHTSTDLDVRKLGDREVGLRERLGQMRAQLVADPGKVDKAAS